MADEPMTEAMLAAGLAALYRFGFDPNEQQEREMVVAIYKAMKAASQ